jgi:hypothetical protein
MTTAAVSEGIPPTAFDTSMAIGVVTDFGANDIITSGEAPINLAIIVTETSPTTQPANCEIRIGISCFFIMRNCRYKGTPNATTAGFNQNSTNEPASE